MRLIQNRVNHRTTLLSNSMRFVKDNAFGHKFGKYLYTCEVDLQVINADQNETNNYTFSMSVIAMNRTLVAGEQVLLATMYSRCCAQPGSCMAWKALTNAMGSNANGGMIMTDFCSFPGQICTPTCKDFRIALSQPHPTWRLNFHAVRVH